MSIKSFTNSMVRTVNTNKILNNDFLYKVVVVLALINVIGYIVSKNVNALIMFTFVYLAINYLTKNMTVVLLTAIFATNFFIVGKKVKEAFTAEGDEETKKKKKKKAVNEDPTSEYVDAESALKKIVDNAEDAEDAEDADKREEYANIAHKLKPTDIAPVEFNSDSAELAKQLKILNERTKNSMGMINKLGGIGNIGKMVDNLTSIVGKLG